MRGLVIELVADPVRAYHAAGSTRGKAVADYTKQWRRYKWIRNAVIVAVVVWALPLGFTGIQLAIFLAWTAVVSILVAALTRWKCPRCGEIFSGGRKHWILLPPKCVTHLGKYSISSSGKSPLKWLRTS